MKHLTAYVASAIFLFSVEPIVAERHRVKGSITTSFAAGAAADRTMFDVTTVSTPITSTSITVHASHSQQSIDIAVYTRPGTFHALEIEDTTWTLVSQTTVTPRGLHAPTIVDVTDVVLPADTTMGMYITVTDTGPGEPQVHYVEGNREFANEDLKLSMGVGIGGMFGYSIENRTWSGTINYTLGAAQ